MKITDNDHQWMASLIACLNSLASGFVLGYSSPTVPQLELLLPTESDVSWYASIIMLGAAFGGIPCWLWLDRFGRKFGLLLTSLPLTAGWICIITANHSAMLHVGRLLTGIAFGIVSPNVSIYISEISKANIRGRLCTLNSVSKMLGMLIAYSLGTVVSWRWLAVSGQAITLIALIFSLYIPETPHFLIMRGKHNEAKAAMMWLRESNRECEQDLKEIAQNLTDSTPATIQDFKLPSVYKPMIQMVLLVLFLELVGPMPITFYGESIFLDAGFMTNPSVPQIINASIKVIFALITTFLMDSVGRRRLLIYSGLLMTLGMLLLGSHFYMMEVDLHHTPWLPLTGVFLYVAAYAFGWGPVPFIFQGEVFPGRIRGISSLIASFVAWPTAFLVSVSFLPLQSRIGTYGVFWLYAALSAVSIAVACFITETKGKSLEEINILFSGDNSDTEQIPLVEK